MYLISCSGGATIGAVELQRPQSKLNEKLPNYNMQNVSLKYYIISKSNP